jgi:sulfatase maturation enzyme AslB (radical SAM superfamily)
VECVPPPQAESPITLVPFVDTLSDRVELALQQVLDLTQGVPLRWYVRDSQVSEWHLHVIVADDVEFDMYPGDTAGMRFWVGTDTLGVNVRSARSAQQDRHSLKRILLQLKRRLTAIGVHDNGIVVQELRDAIDHFNSFREISDFMYRSQSPREAVIRLGFRCNQDCGFCWQSRKWPEPPAEYYDHWLEAFGKTGCREVTFSGGEPTIHSELPRLMERASQEYGMEVAIQTNAIRFRKRPFAESIVAKGLTRAFVSYHSHIAEVSDQMTSARGTHRGTESGIRMLLELGVQVELNCVVERQNYEHLAAHAEHIVKSFVEPFGDHPVTSVQYSHPCQYYADDNWRASVVPLDELKASLLAATALLEAAGTVVIVLGTCGFPPCVLGKSSSVLEHYVRDEQASNDVSGRVYADVCSDCSMQSGCLGVRKEYLDVHGSRGLKAFS